MIIEPVGKPKPYPLTFGIYKRTIVTSYGYKNIGEYRGKTFTFHHDIVDNTKMVYVQRADQWIKSKLEYFHNGVKKIIRSKAK